MKKLWAVLIVFTFLSCTQQIINQDTTFLDNHTFEEVWKASVRAVKDIDFTIDSMDKETGFISAESGRRVFESRPPRLSIMITEMDSKVSVDCRVLQKEFIDLGGHGKKTVRNFMTALNMNLNR
ncbi:MAG: hypothetical protein GQ545_04435 [Candidatus Aminicenantes bacterium]|nr:hypothetical protein [Candidatus Aminicenantes bacterium]